MSAAHQRPYLELAQPDGPAAHFVGRSVVEEDPETFFLTVRQPTSDAEGFFDGDVLAVSSQMDAEPGDLVVWWTGSPASQALARVNLELGVDPVGGFLPPAENTGAPAQIRGVIVGRLRKA